MRIAYICADPGIPVFGRKGASIHVQEVIRALGYQGAQVELFTPRPGGTAPADLASVPVHLLPPVPKGQLAEREQQALAANTDLRESLHRTGHFDLVYERYSLWSYAGIEYAHAMNTPGIVEVNAPLIKEQASHRGLMDRTGAERVAEYIFGTATALLAVSDGVADYLTAFPAARGRVQVVPNGVNPERFPADLSPALPKADGVFTVGFVGTLKPWHGLETLIEAFAALHGLDPSVRLLIVGDGPQREALQGELAAYGVADAVHFTGSVRPEAVPAWLAAMDVAVAPYPALSQFYFSPLKVFEYMAASLSVVASRIGQITGLIDNGVTGLLCAPGSSESLVSALKWLQDEPDLRRQLGRAAREIVLAHYTWEAVVGRILAMAGLDPEPTPQVSLLRGRS